MSVFSTIAIIVLFVTIPLCLIAWALFSIDTTLRTDSMRREMDKLMREDA